MFFMTFCFQFNNYRSYYGGESWEVWQQFGDEETYTDTAEEPVCTEVRYRANLTLDDGETHSFESEPVQFELDDSMDLETVAHIAMHRIDEGKMMEIRWSDIACIEGYSITVCADEECEEAVVEREEERFVREVDPCREYTVTITPNAG